MSVMQADIVAIVNNDETYNFQITYGPAFLNLTGLTPTFYLKASRTALDNTAYQAAPTVTAPALGQMTITVPRAQFPAAGTMWYRVDVTNVSSQVNTVIMGVVTVLSA
jgi:hypothetical protein